MPNKIYSFELRDLIYIVIVLVPIAVTWGVYTTKMTNLTDKVIEVRAENTLIKEEDKHLRELIYKIEIEVNSNKKDINNLRERVTDIIKNQRQLFEGNHEKPKT